MNIYVAYYATCLLSILMMIAYDDNLTVFIWLATGIMIMHVGSGAPVNTI